MTAADKKRGTFGRCSSLDLPKCSGISCRIPWFWGLRLPLNSDRASLQFVQIPLHVSQPRGFEVQ